MNDIKLDELEYRMYGFVPYQLSGIQSGIQFGHGVVEYANVYHNTTEYKKWSTVDKTFIVLNGGTTNSNPNRLGTINEIVNTLKSLDISFVTFNEPDLGDQLTSINFLLDERVWDTKKYPNYNILEDSSIEEIEEFRESLINVESTLEARRILKIREFISKFKLASN